MQRNGESETTICRLCLQPVTNFICTDCLFAGIQKWVSKNSSGADSLMLLLSGKNAEIKRLLSQDNNRAFCVSHRGQVDEIACPCCYLYEMQSAIKSYEPGIARKFEKDFNFDFMFHHGMSQLSLWESIHGGLLASKSFRPVIITDRRAGLDLNVCEGCESESDDIVEVDGRWICESCREAGAEIY